MESGDPTGGSSIRLPLSTLRLIEGEKAEPRFTGRYNEAVSIGTEMRGLLSRFIRKTIEEGTPDECKMKCQWFQWAGPEVVEDWIGPLPQNQVIRPPLDA